PVCGAVLAPTPVRLTHHPSLLPLRPGFVQQSPINILNLNGFILQAL
ncbi:hypothetical protein ABIE32_003975, partial [Comamonas sp. 4034]